jgi:hypothetical protein
MLPLIEVVEQVHIGGIKQAPADGFDDLCVDKCRRFDTWVPTVLPLRRITLFHREVAVLDVSLRRTNSCTTLASARSPVLIRVVPKTLPGPRSDGG